MKTKIQSCYKYLPFILFSIYVLWIHHNVGLLDGDDKVYQNTFLNTTLLSWIKDFYLSWGGRVPLQLLDILFLNLPLFCWKLWNAALYILIPIYIYRIILLLYPKLAPEKLFLVNFFICGLLMAIPADILNSSILWVTGSFNYLLPASMLLLALYPFAAALTGTKIHGYDRILAILGILLTCYAEQTAAVFICLSIYCLVYAYVSTRRFPVSECILFLFGAVNAIIQYAAPGNHVRSQAELLKWNQTFDMYSLFDKVLLGLIHFLKNVFVPGFFYFIIFLFLLAVISSYQKRSIQIYQLFLCCLTVLVKVFVTGMEDNVIWQIYSTRTLLKLGIILLWILLTAWFLICTFSNLVSLLFLGAIAAGVVMGMSPTIFASGNRVFLLSYILIILLCVLGFSHILNAMVPHSDTASRP